MYSLSPKIRLDLCNYVRRYYSFPSIIYELYAIIPQPMKVMYRLDEYIVESNIVPYRDGCILVLDRDIARILRRRYGHYPHYITIRLEKIEKADERLLENNIDESWIRKIAERYFTHSYVITFPVPICYLYYCKSRNRRIYYLPKRVVRFLNLKAGDLLFIDVEDEDARYSNIVTVLREYNDKYYLDVVLDSEYTSSRSLIYIRAIAYSY